MILSLKKTIFLQKNISIRRKKTIVHIYPCLDGSSLIHPPVPFCHLHVSPCPFAISSSPHLFVLCIRAADSRRREKWRGAAAEGIAPKGGCLLPRVGRRLGGRSGSGMARSGSTDGWSSSSMPGVERGQAKRLNAAAGHGRGLEGVGQKRYLARRRKRSRRKPGLCSSGSPVEKGSGSQLLFLRICFS